MPLKTNAKRSKSSVDIKKTSFDLQIDELISESLGAEFRRASIYDIYPLVRSNKKKAEYNNYARNFLKKFSQGLLLKVYKFNFDRDALYDYAVIVHNVKDISNHLLIANKKKTLYFEEFQGDYLESVAGGKFPTVVLTEDSKLEVNAPALKIVSISEKGKVIYRDFVTKQWKEYNLAF